MRLTLVALVAVAACSPPRKQPSNEGALVDASPPPVVPPPVLAPVEGATAEGGAGVFARACAGCHGAAGKGDGPQAASLKRAPTDLTREGFLCRSTTGGTRPAPADTDVDGALDRGSHVGLPPLSPVERRSALLHVRALAPATAQPAKGMLLVPPETADTPADRERGRLLYYAVGCWRCHGPTGGGDGDFVRELAWNGRALGRLPPLSAHGSLCGPGATRLYLTVALGLGTSPAIMPRHLEMLELVGRPKEGEPATWTRALEGRIPPADVEAVRAFLGSLPERKVTLTLGAPEREARGAAMTWSLVHWIKSLPSN